MGGVGGLTMIILSVSVQVELHWNSPTGTELDNSLVFNQYLLTIYCQAQLKLKLQFQLKLSFALFLLNTHPPSRTSSETSTQSSILTTIQYSDCKIIQLNLFLSQTLTKLELGPTQPQLVSFFFLKKTFIA